MEQRETAGSAAADEARMQAIVPRLLAWYATHARSLPWRTAPPDAYRVWISEVMLQQTRVEAVIPYYTRFLEAFPDVGQLAQADEERVFKYWEGLGYYTRARNLHKAARQIAAQYGGHFPASADAIRALPGIGAYTAGAIASIAFGQPEPAVDGNVLRVLSRLLADNRDILQPAVRRDYTERLRAVYPLGQCGDFTQSLMELGALVCLPGAAAHCHRCPLADLCRALATDTVRQYPVKAAKKVRPVAELTVFLLASARTGRIALQRRAPDSGVLHGLWAFPHVEGAMPQPVAQDWLCARWGTPKAPEAPEMPDGPRGPEAPPGLLRLCPPARHVFTHLEWNMTVYACVVDPISESGAGETDSRRDTYPDTRWVTRQELRQSVALPTAFRKLIPYLPMADGAHGG